MIKPYKKILFIYMILITISGCGEDPLTRSQCREVIIKSSEIFANYNSRNTKFKENLNKIINMNNEEFDKEMNKELNQCQANWDQSDYKCIFETTKLMGLKKCDLEID